MILALGLFHVKRNPANLHNTFQLPVAGYMLSTYVCDTPTFIRRYFYKNKDGWTSINLFWVIKYFSRNKIHFPIRNMFVYPHIIGVSVLKRI